LKLPTSGAALISILLRHWAYWQRSGRGASLSSFGFAAGAWPPLSFRQAWCRGVASFSRLEEQYRRNGVDIEKGFGVVVIGRATCRLLSRSCGASPEAPRWSYDAEAQTVSCGGDRSVWTISGRGREGNREGMSGGEPRIGHKSPAELPTIWALVQPRWSIGSGTSRIRHDQNYETKMGLLKFIWPAWRLAGRVDAPT